MLDWFSFMKWRFHRFTVFNKFAYILVLNEVPTSKVKEKHQDKLMTVNTAVKDDRQQQQSRDREMREAHGEKQNYSVSKSRELKVRNLPIYSGSYVTRKMPE